MGGLKYIALWRKIIQASTAEKFSGRAVYSRMLFDYLINILTFVLLFFVRKQLPLNFTVTAVETAVGLSLIGRYFSVRRIFEKISAEE